MYISLKHQPTSGIGYAGAWGHGELLTLGQKYNIGERPTIILYTYTYRDVGTLTLITTTRSQYGVGGW